MDHCHCRRCEWALRSSGNRCLSDKSLRSPTRDKRASRSEPQKPRQSPLTQGAMPCGSDFPWDATRAPCTAQAAGAPSRCFHDPWPAAVKWWSGARPVHGKFQAIVRRFEEVSAFLGRVSSSTPFSYLAMALDCSTALSSQKLRLA